MTAPPPTPRWANFKITATWLEVDYNYYFDPPPSAQPLANAPAGPLSLKLNPPGDSGRVIVGLLDTAVQSLDGSLNDFLLKQLSVAGDAPANSSDVTHGTAMAYTILAAIAAAEQGGSSVQIQPVDVYGPNPTTTSWDVALGVQAAVNNGATVLNMSLGSSGDSSVLDDVIQSAEKDGIVFFAAAGNQSVSTPTYPAAMPGVIAVTAMQNGQIAPYADFGSFVSLAFAGNNVVYWGSQAYMVVGNFRFNGHRNRRRGGKQNCLGRELGADRIGHATEICRSGKMKIGRWQIGIELGKSQIGRKSQTVNPDAKRQTPAPAHLMRLAPDFAEGDDVGEKSDDEQPRLAGQQEQDAPAQNQANQQINQNRQRKFHQHHCTVFAAARK